MNLKDYKPTPKLVTKITNIQKPSFPVIDFHNHLAEPFGGGWDKKTISPLLDILDEAEVSCLIDLDGGWGESIFHRHLDFFKGQAQDRFRVFCGVEWTEWQTYGDKFGEWSAKKLRQHAAQGADGLKIWKNFGLSVQDQYGERVKLDDERLTPVWAAASELGLPILIHSADPVAFFDPIDAQNERYEELSNHRDWHFPSPGFPPFQQLMDELFNLVKKHPQTRFVGAHVGCYAENLDWVGTVLDTCPNYYVDISARLAELGRQPYTARQFFIDYADRILFGTDSDPNLDNYRRHYRFLESDDEYFDYSLEKLPPQGRWQIYGLFLPPDVLRKIYYQNAMKLLGE